jgi:hypothetical protein
MKCSRCGVELIHKKENIKVEISDEPEINESYILNPETGLEEPNLDFFFNNGKRAGRLEAYKEVLEVIQNQVDIPLYDSLFLIKNFVERCIKEGEKK